MTPQLLMIEDDERLAKMVGDYLRQSGFGFSHAAVGAHGLKKFTRFGYFGLDAARHGWLASLSKNSRPQWSACANACADVDRQRRSHGPHHWLGTGRRRLLAQAF
jgi:hypothetical protein